MGRVLRWWCGRLGQPPLLWPQFCLSVCLSSWWHKQPLPFSAPYPPALIWLIPWVSPFRLEFLKSTALSWGAGVGWEIGRSGMCE